MSVHSRVRVFACLTVLAFCLGLSPSASKAEMISLRADLWCPYNCAPGDDQPGYLIEVAQIIFQAAGHQGDYRLMKWQKALEEVEKGTFNAVVGASKRRGRRLIYPEEAMGMSRMAFFVRKGDPWRFEGGESLLGVNLGVIARYDYGELQKMIDLESSPVFAFGKDALVTNIQRLLDGEIDALVEDESVMRYMLKELGLSSKIQLAGHSRHKNPVYIAFTQNQERSRVHAGLMDEGIRALRANGELAQILARYGLEPWWDPDDPDGSEDPNVEVVCPGASSVLQAIMRAESRVSDSETGEPSVTYKALEESQQSNCGEK
ncbi:substrate-binding periplasmic protein [Rhodovibrionaceae bacterium A322]